MPIILAKGYLPAMSSGDVSKYFKDMKLDFSVPRRDIEHDDIDGTPSIKVLKDMENKAPKDLLNEFSKFMVEVSTYTPNIKIVNAGLYWDQEDDNEFSFVLTMGVIIIPEEGMDPNKELKILNPDMKVSTDSKWHKKSHMWEGETSFTVTYRCNPIYRDDFEDEDDYEKAKRG